MSTRKNLPANIERRREDAKARQAEYNSLTIAQKLARLDAGGFVAKKQRAKLQLLAEKGTTNEGADKKAPRKGRNS